MQSSFIRMLTSPLYHDYCKAQKNSLAHVIGLQRLAHRRRLVNISHLYLSVSPLIPQELNAVLSRRNPLSLVLGYNFTLSHLFYYLAFSCSSMIVVWGPIFTLLILQAASNFIWK
jgi:hypothetical protein